VFSRINTNELLEYIRKLPPATQAVFNLFVFEGYSHKAIAEAAGISEGTSKWHLNEARKKLKQMITTIE
jgi:RNA polymerase sigma-70 factor (ECF subfamily)